MQLKKKSPASSALNASWASYSDRSFGHPVAHLLSFAAHGFVYKTTPLLEAVNPPTGGLKVFDSKQNSNVIGFLPEHFSVEVHSSHSHFLELRQEDVVKLDMLGCLGLLEVHAAGLHIL